MQEINEWGYYCQERGILIERIEEASYLWQIKILKNDTPTYYAGISTPKYCKEDEVGNKTKPYIKLTIGNEKSGIREYQIRKMYSEFPYQLLPIHEAKKYVATINQEKGADPHLIKSTAEIYTLIKNTFDCMHDSPFPYEHDISTLGVMQSWLVPYLMQVFFIGIDATKGAGKTTLLELKALLCRHGYLADISAAGLPRVIEKYNCTIMLDELDEYDIKDRKQIEKMMRKGQRKGQRYTRMNKHTLEPEFYDTFTMYAYSFRSKVEDAVYHRSFQLHGGVTKDNRLPINNAYKDQLLQPVFVQVFFWGFNRLSALSYIEEPVTMLPSLPLLLGVEHETDERRERIYRDILSKYSKEETNVLDKLVGRNAELGYHVLYICKILGLSLNNIIKEVLQNKQDDESVQDEMYHGALQDMLNRLVERLKEIAEDPLSDPKLPKWYIKEGRHAFHYYYPKNEVFSQFCSEVKNLDLNPVSESRFNRLIRDLGFIPDKNWVNHRKASNQKQAKCLVFDEDVCKNIGFEKAVLFEGQTEVSDEHV